MKYRFALAVAALYAICLTYVYPTAHHRGCADCMNAELRDLILVTAYVVLLCAYSFLLIDQPEREQ